MAEKTLNPSTLNISAQAYLEEILNKNEDDLTVQDIGFLKARSAYLTADQREFFSKALSGRVKGVDYVNAEKVEATSEGVVYDEDEEGNKTINAKKSRLDTLIQMAKDADLVFPEDVTKAELAELLNNR